MQQADDILWQAETQQINNCKLFKFIQNISSKYAIDFASYHQFYDWTVENNQDFWREFIDYAGIVLTKDYQCVLRENESFNKNRWFDGAKTNFAQNLLESKFNQERLKQDSNYTALIAVNEQGNRQEYSLLELKQKVSILAHYFQSLGLKPGDRVAGLIPNNAEAVIAMLATTACGAVWTACSPDFGEAGILERFKQIEPRIIFITDGYFYKNKYFDCLQKNKTVINELKNSLSHVIAISDANNLDSQNPEMLIGNSLGNYSATDMAFSFDYVAWEYIFAHGEIKGHYDTINYVPVDFNAPVYIMFSSGTTGQPKCIVHGVGGILLEHFKEHLLHNDLKYSDRFMYFTTTSWMMWHWLVSALGVGTTVILYDGAPNYPTNTSLLDLIDELDLTVFGASAKYYSSLEKENLNPRQSHKFSNLRMLFSTGSPLVSEQFDYIYSNFKSDLALCSISGGTDIIGCFALGNPMLPIYKGQLQCRSLGMDVRFFDDDGNEVVDQKAELVCIKPFPSMPIKFWNDPEGIKYHHAYFEKFDNIWAHGDYGKLTQQKGVVIYGRSDAVLNPGGVRIGTAEIYAQIEKIPEVIDSIAVGQSYHQDERIILFVVLAEGSMLDNTLRDKIKHQIKNGASPRHVPALIIDVPDLPRTTSGKLVELAVKNIIAGQEVKNINALANPKSLEYFANLPELD